MLRKRTIVLLVGTALLGASLYFTSEWRAECWSPRVLGWFDSPQAEIEAYIEQKGGLPKRRVDLGQHADSVTIYPIREIKPAAQPMRVWRSRSLLQELWDDDPTYAIDAMFDVVYEDGVTASIYWSSWRYGVVFCPVVWSRGDGPPGHIRLTSAKQPQ